MAFSYILTLGMIATAAATAPRATGGVCQVTRVLADGREVRSTVPDRTRGSSSVRRGNGAAAASASSRGTSGSSVSSSSSSVSSGGRSRSMARAVSSYTDEAGRTVTTSHDGRGCTIVIDESDLSGEE